MTRWTPFGLALLLAAGAGGATHEVRTPNFTVVTDASEHTGEAIARRLEAFHRLLEDAFPGEANDLRKHVLVFAVSDQAAMARLLPSIWEDETARRPDGIFREGLDKDYIVVRLDAPSEGPYATIYHETFHVFSRNRFGRLPLWLDEGLAKFWEMTTFESDQVRLGGVSRRNLKILAEEPPLPLPILFAIDHQSPHYQDTEDSAVFYAQSWALAHFLLLGDDSGTYRRQFFELIRAAEGSATAQHPFDDVDALAKSLRAYTDGSRFKAIERAAPEALPENEVRTRVLSEAESLALRGDFLVHGEIPARARPLLERALELDPDLALVHEGFGMLALTEGDTQRALEAFARAAELDSSSFLAHYYQAVASLRAGASLETVLTGLDRSIEANPDFAPAHSFVATAVAELGDDYDRGLASARKLVALTPTDPEAHQILGRLLVASGDKTAGIAAYRTAVELTSSEPQVFRELALDLLEVDLVDEACLALERASALDPADPETAFTLALALSEAGRVDDAIRAFETATTLAPDTARYHYRLAELLMENDRNAEAIPVLERSLELNPDAIALRRDLGRALLATGRAEAALPHLRAAVEQSPRLASLHFELATALTAVGNTDEAERHFRIAEELAR